MKAPLPTERQTQRTILKMMGTCFRDVLTHHSPNGANLAGSAGPLLGDGMRKGWPDITCHWSPGKTAYLEIKRPKLGKVSPDQEAMHEKLRSLGFPVAVVTSQDEAYHFLEQCGAPRSAEML